MKRQVLWFLIIGSLGFVVDAGMTQGLTFFTDIHPVIARVPAIVMAVLTTFILNKNITFQAQDHCPVKTLGAYSLSQMASQAVNFSIYTVLVSSLPLLEVWPVFAVMAGSIVAMVLSFILSKKWVFKPQ